MQPSGHPGSRDTTGSWRGARVRPNPSGVDELGPRRPDPGDTGRVRHAWILAVLSACFHPSPPEGKACANGTDCPDPLICDLGVCVRSPHDSGVDIDAPPDVSIDANLSCSCLGSMLTCGGVAPVTCALGCMPQAPGARCYEVDPSNGVGLTSTNGLTMDITINGGVATFNTDSGAITGVVTRAAGQGVNAGIAFELRTTGTQPIGVWTFHRLGLNSGATIHFTGGRSAVFVSGTDAAIGGTIDGSGGCYAGDPMCGGPGAGLGGNTAPASGCGPGGVGASASTGTADGGGGGGGGRGAGGVGGLGGADGTGGLAGGACVATTAEPLVGGSGGGIGGLGAVTACKGGGGGGALQITAVDEITVDGTITVGGSGGEGGKADIAGANAGAGCGGGAGGTILLEARSVKLGPMAVVAANGGAGGGGGSLGIPGSRGASGGLTTTPAIGGGAGNTGNGGAGGSGAAGAMPAGAGVAGSGNAGAGGGGIGTIYVRTTPGNFTQAGVITPAAGSGPLRTQ